jgi:1,4-alpha-glucan branching enzyme
MKKAFSKSRDACEVTFRLPRPAVGNASSVSVAGDFNDWRAATTPLKRQKDGSFAVTVELPAGREYLSRYLIDSNRWENDWDADRYEPSGYPGVENSVLEL